MYIYVNTTFNKHRIRKEGSSHLARGADDHVSLDEASYFLAVLDSKKRLHARVLGQLLEHLARLVGELNDGAEDDGLRGQHR